MVRIAFATVLSLFLTSASLAYETGTHRVLSEHAVALSKLDAFAQTALGLPRGDLARIGSRSLSAWIEDGSAEEDDLLQLPPRVVNHFHDPMRAWNVAGLQGVGTSSAIWAQNQTGARPDASWFEVRRLLDHALTYSVASGRETYLIEALRGLGHQIHLVQDAAVTAHARDDMHVAWLGDPEILETHVDRVRTKAFAKFAAWLAPPLRSDGSLLATVPANASTPVPIASLIDRSEGFDQPTGPYVGTDVGLAEFTNTNFFSQDTIFRRYELPSADSLGIRFIDSPDGPGGARRRFYRAKAGEGVPVDHFVVEGSLSRLYGLDPSLGSRAYALDSRVVEDYAAKLLPRAVGYSADLIDYFVRGSVALVEDARRRGRYEIENRSAEEMQGVFTVYYDDRDGYRRALGTADTRQSALPAGGRTRISLADPIRPKRPGEYLTVFRGRLGLEGKPDVDQWQVAIGAGISVVQAAPGADAGGGHDMIVDQLHTHRGGTASDVNGDLTSYRWSLVSCPAVCPGLSASSGSLSGGLDPVDVPPPSYTPNADGQYHLLLEVFDAAGHVTTDELVETPAERYVPGYDGNGIRGLFPEPSISTVQSDTFPAGTRHVHRVSVHSVYGEPWDFLFSWSVCRENGTAESDCEQPVETNFPQDPATGWGRLPLEPDQTAWMEFTLEPATPGTYWINLQWTSHRSGTPLLYRFINVEETVE